MRQLAIGFALFALSMTAQAVDLSGDSTGKIHISEDGTSMPAYLRLDHEDSTVTGQAGPSAGQLFPIKHAVLSDNTLTIETSASSPILLMFELTFRDDKLSGRVFEDGALVGPVQLERGE